jgi:hypothetical protein
MALGFTVALQNSILNAITTDIDSGSGAGKVRIYNGSRPADADTAVSGQTLLAELTLSDPSAAAASGGVWTANSVTGDASADATGTASWFRVLDSDNNVVMDGDVGTSGSDLNLNSTSLTVGGTVDITSFVLNAGNS